MKKLSIVLVLLLAISLLAVSVFAAQTATVTVTTSNTAVHRGETVTVTVSVSAVDNCEAGGFRFNYNTDVFEYVSGNALVIGYTGAGISTLNDQLAGYFMGNAKNVEGDIFEVVLRVKDDAAYGDYTITGTPKMKSDNKDVTCTLTAANITVACNHTNTYSDNGDGTHTVTCSSCGNATTEAHNFVNGTCACGATEVLTDANLKVARTDFILGADLLGAFLVNAKGYDEVYVEFVLDGDSTIAHKAEYSSGNWQFFEYMVFASNMTENITVTVYGKKGSDVYLGQTMNWTVRDGVIAKLDAAYPNYNTVETDAKQCRLLVSMLHYGAEAQKLFNKENTDLPTDGVNPEYLALISNVTPNRAEPTVDETGKTAKVSTSGLMLQEKVKLYGNFKLSSAVTNIEEYRVVVEHIKADGTTVPYEIVSSSGNLVANGKYITYYFGELAGNELCDDLIITLYQGDVAVSATITRSVEMIATTQLSSYPDLIPAIMSYAECSKAYFN